MIAVKNIKVLLLQEMSLLGAGEDIAKNARIARCGIGIKKMQNTCHYKVKKSKIR